MLMKVEIDIRTKYNQFGKEWVNNPFKGTLACSYRKEALNKVTEELAKGKTKGTIALKTLKNAVVSMYNPSVEMEVMFQVKEY